MIDQVKQSPEAENKSVCHTDSECKQMYKDLSAELKAPALEMLAKELKSVTPQITKTYKLNPKTWYVPYHLFWGMEVRNLLRNKGYGEDYFGVHNLDDIYIALVEEALGLGQEAKA